VEERRAHVPALSRGVPATMRATSCEKRRVGETEGQSWMPEARRVMAQPSIARDATPARREARASPASLLPVDHADRDALEAEVLSQLIRDEALIREVHGLGRARDHDEQGRRGLRLRDVVEPRRREGHSSEYLRRAGPGRSRPGACPTRAVQHGRKSRASIRARDKARRRRMRTRHGTPRASTPHAAFGESRARARADRNCSPVSGSVTSAWSVSRPQHRTHSRTSASKVLFRRRAHSGLEHET
jgi:hypothetical protein